MLRIRLSATVLLAAAAVLAACGGGGSGGGIASLPVPSSTAIPVSIPPNAVFVTNFNGGSVSVIDPATNSVIKTFGGFAQPSSIVANAMSPFVYFVDFWATEVFAIDTRTSAVSLVGGGLCLASVTMRPSSMTAYDTESCGIGYDVIDGSAGNRFSKVDLSQFEAAPNYFFGGWQLLAVPSQPLLYFADTHDNTLYQYNEATKTMQRVLVDGASTWALTSNAAGTIVYAGTNGDFITAISTSTNSKVGSVQVGPAGQIIAALALDPRNEQMLYACNLFSDEVVLIDTTTMTIVKHIPVGKSPDGIAIDASGANVYVANDADGTVSVIDVASNTVKATIPVGPRPRAIAIRR